MIGMTHALRRRINAARGDNSEGGFALAYVLLVTAVVMIGVATMAAVTTSNIMPARVSQDRMAAMAAAQAGVQDAVAYLNGADSNGNIRCPKPSARCDVVANDGSWHNSVANALAGGHQTYRWRAIGYVSTPDSTSPKYIRIQSEGTARNQTRTLIADVQGINAVLDYEYYTTYETNGSANLAAQFPARDVYLDCAKLTLPSTAKLKFTCDSTFKLAHWDGAGASSPSTSICDKVWYDSSELNGRDTRTGRWTVQSGQSLTPGSDWRESETKLGMATSTRDVPCQVAFTSGQTFNGPVYTADAPLISRGVASGSGPVFSRPISTAWQPSDNPAAPSPAIRNDPYVGGTAQAKSRANVQTFAPSFASTSGACVFFGPTRIKVSGTVATVTSPQTSARASLPEPRDCYSSRNAAGSYLVDYSSKGKGIVYVQDNKPASGTLTTANTGQRALKPDGSPTTLDDYKQVFRVSSVGGGAADPRTNPAASAKALCTSTDKYSADPDAPCAWSNLAAATDGGDGWTTSSSAACSTLNSGKASAVATDQQNFNCEFNSNQASGNPPSGQYSIYNQRIRDALATNSFSTTGAYGSCASQTFAPSAASATQLGCLVQNFLNVANTKGNQANYPNPTIGDHQYVAVASTPAVTKKNVDIGSAPPAPLTSDSFFATQAGAPAQQTKTTSTTTIQVKRQVWKTSLGCLLGCWDDDKAQFKLTVSQSTYSFQPAVVATSYFPAATDVTQFRTGTNGANGTSGPGDVYIEGNNSGNLSVLADGDAIITGDLTRDSLTAGTLLDTLGNVRIQHRVDCVSSNPTAIAATQPGFCPNDLTGLYTEKTGQYVGGLSSAAGLDPKHPAMQYVNVGTPVSRIDAALVAQGSSRANGSVQVDNVDRGVGLGELTLNGGTYQRHRGSLGVQWDLKATDSGRATSGYKLKMNYVDLQATVPYTPTFEGGSANRYWNVVSVSTQGGGS